MDGWSIRGDADITPVTTGGVTYGLNNTERSFASMNFAGWELKFQHLAPDFFSYTIKTQNAKGKGAIVPVDGQEIHIYYDGVRKFRGHVVKPKLDLNTLSITAYGPWWWATKIQLSGDLDDETGTSAERAIYGLPQQVLKTSLRTIIDRAADMGVPWTKFTDADVDDRISTMFTFAETTLSNMSFAAAIASLMENVPDAVLWFDYDGFTVKPMITRRGAMTAISYEVGSTGSIRVISAPIFPRTDQRPARVEINHAEREATTGRLKWASQAAGTAKGSLTAAQKRRVQIITLAGPEPVDLLPKDEVETIKVQTDLWTDITRAFVRDRDGTLSGIYKNLGGVYGGIDRSLTYYDGWSKDKDAHTLTFPGMTIKSVSGKALKAAQKWLVISDDPLPEWAQKELSAAEVEISGTWIAQWTGNGWNDIFNAMRAAAFATINSVWRNAANEPAVGWDDRIDYAVLSWTIRAWVISSNKASLTTIYKPRDYDFVPLPSGLAGNFYDAQDWIPYEGSVTIKRPGLNGYNGLQRKFNLTEAHPDYATMNALVRSVSYRGPNTVTWELGPPPRIDSGGLVNKMRRPAKGVVKWL